MKRRQRERLTRVGLVVLLALVVGAFALIADWSTISRGFWNREVAADMFPEVVTIAAKNTIIYTALGFSLGLVLGLVLALMKLSTIRIYRWLATVYIEVFRGIPALITLILVGFGLPIALDGFNVPGGIPGQVATGLGIVAAAYMAETIRAGIEAVPKGQMEAARSLGMSHSRAMGSIIIPQAFRIIVPPLTNELVLLIKDSSLVFVLGTTPMTKELTKFGRDAMSGTFNGTPLTVIAIMYLVITIPMTQLVAWMERRTKVRR